MKYRTLAGVQVSQLGFGCMRLPILGHDMTKIDEPLAMKMIRDGIDQGINYIDTAYPYHSNGFGGSGESEPFLAKVLQDGYREKVHLATKLPSWLVKTREDMDKYLNEQLERLETSCIEFYLVHSVRSIYWDHLVKLGIFDFLNQAKAAGKIKYVGFSFHDDLTLFKRVVDSYEWDFCQIQLNYIDVNYQAGIKGLEYAHKKGLDVIIMEPLRGGDIAANLPNAVIETFNEVDPSLSPVEWAFKYLYNRPEVSLVLSGMSAEEHVQENIKIASKYDMNHLSSEAYSAYEKAKEIYDELIKVKCTGCGYCMPCPVGVNIPLNFQLYNESSMFKSQTAYLRYNHYLKDSNASLCVACGKCEQLCPQNLPIIEHLQDVHDNMSLGES